jgi:hypothetical protein
MEQELMAAILEAERLLGWAKFYLTKDKIEAAMTLAGKASEVLDQWRP